METTTNIDVRMPLMGEGITEVQVVRWLKKPGESISANEPLLEVSTDKVDTEIPSPVSGIIGEVLAGDGETVAVNAVVARIQGAGAGGAQGVFVATQAVATTPGAQAKTPAREPAREEVATPKASGASVATGPITASPCTNQLGRSSPLVRKLAKEKNINLQQVEGTGLGGRIMVRDLDAYLAIQRSPAAAGHKSASASMLKTTVLDGKELLEGVPIRREKMSKMRTLIAEHMLRSVQTSPHVTTVFEMDCSAALRARAAMQCGFQEQHGFKLSLTPFFIHTAARSIAKHPIVNVSLDGHEILWKDQINIGCAVALEAGLIVPVIRNAQDLSLTGIAVRLNDLAMRARSKKLQPEEVVGGTFSITNPGMFGCIVSTPIINQPQVAILSIGTVVKRVVVVDDMMTIRPMVQVGLTFDHRVIDGEGGARFLATFKELLESYSEP